jgi:large subunit ribosomal protein L37Ae
LPKMKKTGLGGGLAVRYGTAPRKRYIGILTRMRRPHECPRCQVKATRRVSVGIWQCRRCGNQFTGGAYMPFTKVGEAAKRSVTAAALSVAAVAGSGAAADLEAADKEAGKPKRKPRRKKTMKEAPKEEAT